MKKGTDATLLLAGAGAILDTCEAVWRRSQPGRTIVRFDLPTENSFAYDISPLREYASDRHVAFLALNNHAINFSRLKVMSDIRSAGYRMDRLLSPLASFVDTPDIGENSFVADGAAVGLKCVMKHNCFIGARAVLGNGVQLGQSVWIEPGAIIGDGAVIGDHTTVGKGVVIAEGARVGRQCELLVFREYRGEIPEKSFYLPEFANPLRIYRAGAD